MKHSMWENNYKNLMSVRETCGYICTTLGVIVTEKKEHCYKCGESIKKNQLTLVCVDEFKLIRWFCSDICFVKGVKL